MNKLRIFISHAWKYNEKYYKLLELLEERKYFDYYNHSVPEHDPLDFKKKSELEKLLRNQISGCHCVLVIAGMYTSYREWIKAEIEMAVDMNKPIIGVKPQAQERIPSLVSENAIEIVGWNTESVVAAIRKHSKWKTSIQY